MSNLWMLLSPEHHEVLHHLFAQIVVDAIDLFLSEQRRQVRGQLLWALQVVTKRLLHNDPDPTAGTERDSTEENKKEVQEHKYTPFLDMLCLIVADKTCLKHFVSALSRLNMNTVLRQVSRDI